MATNTKWNKADWYKLLGIVVVIAIFYFGFKFNQNTVPSTQNITPEQTAPQNTAPAISIKSDTITEENFIGKAPIITGKGMLADQARSFVQATLDDFRKQANTDVPDMRLRFGADSPTAHYEIDIDATYAKGAKTESIAMTVYTYTGGAHGESVYKVINASVPGGKILSLSDIIKTKDQKAFTDLVKKELLDWKPEGSDISPVFPDYVNALTFDSFQNWTLDDKNLTIYFDQYAVGPGALGALKFPLPLTQIKNFLSL